MSTWKYDPDWFAEDSVDRFGHDHEFTKLVIDLKGKDPDDAFSSIPYEKVLPAGNSSMQR